VKITHLQVFLINPGHKVSYGTGWGKNTVLVKVYTDEGIDGVGEAFGTGKAKTTEAALHEFEHWLKGKDPTEIVRNWYAYYRGSRYPLGTATMAALSAVEQALWDISGKACGLPVYKMLGGPTRDRIKLYASGYLCQPRHFDLPGDDLVGACQARVAAGFKGVKFTPQPDDYANKSPEQVLRDAVERVRSVREAIGEEVDICLDYHGRSFSPVEAIRLARAIEPYHPLFLEEPALTETPDSLLEAKNKTSIPIAGGERCISRDRLRELLEKRALHILQPEPTANGGILETVKWAAMCELYHVVLAPHQACGPVSLLACAHVDASIPNFLIQECNVDVNDPFVKNLYTPLPQIKDGYLRLPQGPGLGIELNEEAAVKHPYRPFDRPVIRGEDGAIGLE
jgi:galactonate dehydratase